jgi:N-acetylmuramate 1-kinase
MQDKEVEAKIFRVLKEMSLHEYVENISLVYGDLSPRRYFRASLRKGAPLETDTDSVIIMYFDSVTPPEAEAKIVKSSFESYLEVGEFFQSGGISVPKVYFASEHLHILVIEDLGSCPIISLAKAGDKKIASVYPAAVSGIHKIQNLDPRDGFFIYERGFDAAVYCREMSEFSDFYLPEDLSTKEKECIQKTYHFLAQELDSFPRVLVHRDYHSWNLMCDIKGNLRVIDFQDALMGTRSYDLVALVHERDIDAVLGPALVGELEDQFFSAWSDPRVREYEYPRVLLQRDLKVAGRFAKVVLTRGLKSYGTWIPGTVRRIAGTLEVLKYEHDLFREFSEVISPYLHEAYSSERGYT